MADFPLRHGSIIASVKPPLPETRVFEPVVCSNRSGKRQIKPGIAARKFLPPSSIVSRGRACWEVFGCRVLGTWRTPVRGVSAYRAGTMHRRPPKGFGPVVGGTPKAVRYVHPADGAVEGPQPIRSPAPARCPDRAQGFRRASP